MVDSNSEGFTDSPFRFGPFRVQFLFSTNGEVIWFHDVCHPLVRSRPVDALTQAVLAKAFRGELVPTEAELARRENRPYETATDLLVHRRRPPTRPQAEIRPDGLNHLK